MFKHILVPTDGSPLSHASAMSAVDLARTTGARITALFAAPAATPIVYREMIPVGYTTPAKHEAMIRKAAATYLGSIEAAARAAGVAYEGVSVTSDFPAETILAQAKKRRCDLIFMASHGRRGLAGVLLGSETQKVLVGSTVPVLVYRSHAKP